MRAKAPPLVVGKSLHISSPPTHLAHPSRLSFSPLLRLFDAPTFFMLKNMHRPITKGGKVVTFYHSRSKPVSSLPQPFSPFPPPITLNYSIHSPILAFGLVLLGAKYTEPDSKARKKHRRGKRDSRRPPRSDQIRSDHRMTFLSAFQHLPEGMGSRGGGRQRQKRGRKVDPMGTP